ncbi:copper homeostasis protein CutC [Aeoliella mucimassa]|uniref:PF03932 family protein CutC n=1 Tax=Aeoliella mucimassa TaxID=2527972 RepID=A0A518ARL5_9BACT|nr:copper homeostasis protein CutC [Aeoliella mucimassa]QDU57365.1 Copper homeostasis protein CutC [Aeoliella mucimassa]
MNHPVARRVQLEVCVGSLADATAAASAGANRLELCSALELGGLTPSLALIEQVIDAVDLPVVVMLRPRAGGFCYSPEEHRCMLRDAELALNAGAVGVVFGYLTPTCEIDSLRTRELVDLAGEHSTVFHRAFDSVSDPSAALDTLIDLGVTRVLTTGGAANAIDGADSLGRLVAQSNGRIEVMPGGGVTAANVAQIVTLTGCQQVHAGAATSAQDESIPPEVAAQLCDLKRLTAGQLRVVDQQSVAELSEVLLGLG